MTLFQQSLTRRTVSISLSSYAGQHISTRSRLPLTTRRTFLWWWKRRSNDWSANLDDSFHRHMLRKQKIVKCKYSKAIRRRQLWGRDPAHNHVLRPLWGRQIPILSDTSHGPSGSSDAPPASSRKNETGERADDNFENFKAYIDKDPFGAVFGRRLMANQKPTHASWSSFSWVLDPGSPRQAQRTPQDAAISNKPPSKSSDITSPHVRNPSQSIKSSPEDHGNQKAMTSKHPNAQQDNVDRTDEYEFDPISMRKVLKSRDATYTTLTSSQSLFDPLLAEKGEEIAVKPYKPHGVVGSTHKSSSERSPSKDQSTDTKAVRARAETSRLAELRTLKAAALGNSIDATAEYHGKWSPETDKNEEDSAKKFVAEPPSDEAPLFSGTIYEAKSDAMLKGIKHAKKDWLNREGFGSKAESPTSPTNQDGLVRSGSGPRKHQTLLQPSLDRINSSSQSPDKLQPSLDRLTKSSKKAMASQTSPKPVLAPYETQESTSEDIDLLRTSDVRAATKYARRSKREVEKTQDDRRRKLDDDFESREKNDDGLSIVFPNSMMESSKKLSESLNNLWHRVRGQPKVWLTDKVHSSSKLQDSNPKDLEKPVRHMKPEGLVNEGPAPPGDQKSATRSAQNFIQSQEVLNAEQQSKARTDALRSTTLELRRLDTEMKLREKALAETLKMTYEDVYGPITVDHRQNKMPGRTERLAEGLSGTAGRADQVSIPSFIARCEDLLKKVDCTITDAVKTLEAHGGTSTANLPASSSKITSDLQAIQAERMEEVAAKTPAEDPAGEVEQSSSTLPPGKTPLLYKVLAYDSSTLQMNIAETTSSMSTPGDSESQPLHPTEVLSRLNNVAKFLPYFGEMEKQGYEIVSGSGDVLLFKKVRAPMISSDATNKPIDVMTKVSTKTSSAPEQPQTPAKSVVEPSAPTVSSPKVRRQEDVFSGSGRKWHDGDGSSGSSSDKGGSEPGWFRKTSKRVLLAGTFTAAVAYVIGVVAEQSGAQVQDVGPRRSRRPGMYSREDSR